MEFPESNWGTKAVVGLEDSPRSNPKKRRITRWTVAIFLFLVATLPLSALNFRIRVYDPESDRSLPDVQVIILETKTRYYTDQKGEADATVPDPGIYTFRTIVPGGGLVQPRLQVNVPGQLITVFTSEPKSEQTRQTVGAGGITVRGRRDDTKLSRYNVRLDEIKRIPGQFGDAMKGLETLPGVSPPPFGGGDIVIRGAEPRSNTYLLDDLPIGYAFHFGGLNQVVHNDLIKSIDIYTGAYPANFSNAIGGVINIETVDEVEKFGGHTTFSLWATNVLFQAPLDDGKGYWIGSGRVSYLHLVLRPYIPDGMSPPFYWDGQFKIHYRFNPEHAIYFYFIGAKDTFAIEVEDTPEWDPTNEPDPLYIGAALDLNAAFHTEAVRYIWQPASNFQNRIDLIYHDNISYFKGKIGVYEAVQSHHNGYAAFKDDFSWAIYKENVILDGGFEYRNFQYRTNGSNIRVIDPEDPNPDPYDTENPDFETVPVDDRHRSSYMTGYGMLSFKGGGLEFKPGFRYDYFEPTNHEVVDPRGTLSYTFEKMGTTLIAGAGTYHQTPDPRTYSPSSANPYLNMEEGRHYGIGLEQVFLKQWTMKLEGYRHYFESLVVDDPYILKAARLREFRDLKDVRTQRHIDELIEAYQEPLVYNDRMGFSNDGTGFSEGYEFYIKKNLAPGKYGWYGWFSYYWSRTLYNEHQHIISDEEKDMVLSADERRILNQYDNSKDHYASFDRTVVVNVVLGYKIDREWQVGLRWNYRTSQPYTPVVGDDGGRQVNHGRVIFDPEYSDLKYSARLKPYHRLDIRIDRFLNYEWGYGNVFVEVLNVYLKKNEAGLSWSSAQPYSARNPRTIYDLGTLEQPVAGGKRMRFPLINAGLEVKF